MSPDLATILVPRQLPGERSRELLRRQAERESNARSYPRRLPFAIDSASGTIVRDVDGNEYLDFLAGAGVLSLGHSHPDLVRIVVEQAPRFVHGLDMPTEVKDAFTEAQLGMLPLAMRDRTRIHFCGPTGANTVDAAVKLAKTFTGRSEVISFRGGFHGTTHLGMALTGLLSQRESVANAVPGVHFAPYSYCARCPIGLTRSNCGVRCATVLESLLNDENGGVAAPAAVILELVQGEGGVIPADLEFVRRVVDAAHAVGALVIVDEVQTGCGRTGTWFAFEQYGFEPDVICASKALSGIGLPLGIILYRDEYDTWAPGAHTGTFRGNQLGFASGVEAIRVIQRDDVLGNIRARGAQVASILDPLRSLPTVRDVRGRGLMWGIELQDPVTGAPDGAAAHAVQDRAVRRGLIVEVGGRSDCVLRLLPPLIVSEAEIQAACDLLVQLVTELDALCAARTHVLDTPAIAAVESTHTIMIDGIASASPDTEPPCTVTLEVSRG